MGTQRLSEIHNIYTIYKALNEPYNETLLYKHGIINESGQVLLTLETMTPIQEKLWSPFNRLVHKLKESIDLSPFQNKVLHRYTAALFLMHEGASRIKTLSNMESSSLLTVILGPRSDTYLRSAAFICEAGKFYKEDAAAVAAPTNAAGSGNVAGIGVGPQGEPGVYRPKQFAGCKVFEVNSTTFQRCLHGKVRYEQYKKYVGNDTIGEEIRIYGRKNPKKGIILMDELTGSMLYLRRPVT